MQKTKSLILIKGTITCFLKEHERIYKKNMAFKHAIVCLQILIILENVIYNFVTAKENALNYYTFFATIFFNLLYKQFIQGFSTKKKTNLNGNAEILPDTPKPTKSLSTLRRSSGEIFWEMKGRTCHKVIWTSFQLLHSSWLQHYVLNIVQ